MWATRPHLANIFKKLLEQKTFICLRLIIENHLFLEKPPQSDSARLGHIPSLPWESQLPLKPCLTLQSFDFKGNCNSSDSLLDFCFISLYSFICFANVGYSPTPRQHFCKTAAPKNFLVRLRLGFCSFVGKQHLAFCGNL